MAAGDALATTPPSVDEPFVSSPSSSSDPRRRPWWLAAGAGVAVMGALTLGAIALRSSLHEVERPALAAALTRPSTPPLGHRDDAMPEPPTPLPEHAESAVPARKAHLARMRAGPRAPRKTSPAPVGTEPHARTGPHVSSAASTLRR